MKDLKAEAMAKNPLESYIRNTGRAIDTKGKEIKTCCFFHDDHHPSMRINGDKGLWYCDVCDLGGNVVDLHMHIKGLNFKQAVEELADVREEITKPTGKKRLIEYKYNDSYGREVFCVQRIEQGGKKTFRQFHTVDGERVFSMKGVSRVLYMMDKIVDKEQVFLVEGEKCVHALVRLGYDATTNCGGSSNWMEAYADMLADKDVVIIPDNDKPGEKWYEAVLKSLAGKVRSVQTINLPQEYNDIGDLYEAKGEDACDVISDLMDVAPVVERGADVPIHSSQEMMDAYIRDITSSSRISCDLGKWLPSLRQKVRPLVRGDMFLVMAATGVGKSAVLQNIAISQKDLTVLFFEIELPKTLMAERWTAISEQIHAESVEKKVRRGEKFDTSKWGNVYTCTLAGLNVDRIEEIINQAELKIGHKPHLVLIDYIGLLAGGSGSRYEKMSSNAEQLKIVAKRTNVIMGLASQLKRKEDGDMAVYLTDAKDSGSIENSCGLILGCWRPSKEEMKIAILKDTKGSAGEIIDCNHGGGNLVITEAWLGSESASKIGRS